MECRYFEVGDQPAHAICDAEPRTWAVSVYLNDPERGGEVRLGRGGCCLRPHKGTALLWKSPAGPGRGVVLEEMPVRAGFKAVLTKSFQVPVAEGIAALAQSAPIPAYTRRGFHRCLVPDTLFGALRAFYELNAANSVDELVPGYIAGDRDVPSQLIQLPSALQLLVHNSLRRTMEQWTNTALTPTYVYGIRRYLRGSTLKVHRDRSSSHVLGATLNIAQQVDEEWPLVIEDHGFRRHEVALQPGEMLLYESERLPHGRPKPLRGAFYAGVFAHYRPSRLDEPRSGNDKINN